VPDPGLDRGWAVLEQLAIGQDPVRSPCQGSLAEVDVVVLPDGEDARTHGHRPFDGRERVVCARRQVDDREFGAVERMIEVAACRRPGRLRAGLRDRT
jgi:hypothetical protein